MKKYRSLFVSDIHLGSMKARANEFIDFLRDKQFDYIYLVGDIIDIWSLKSKKYWPQRHTDVIRKLLKRSKHAKIFYIPGNHDEFLFEFNELLDSFGNISFCEEIVHTTVDGKSLLIIHGHQFDGVVKHAKWLMTLGDSAYEFTIVLTRWYHYFCRKFGWRYISLSAYAKQNVKKIVNFINDFEKSVAHYAQNKKVNGIVCGHLHTPSIRQFDSIMYYNCGDWVDSCTAIVEDYDGKMEMLVFDPNESSCQTEFSEKLA